MIGKRWNICFVACLLMLLGMAPLVESYAWARAGGGVSSGSRGGRSSSAPTMPSRPAPSSPQQPSPGVATPIQPSQPYSGGLSRSPFWQGLAGGLAGGLLGSLLFGGRGVAAPMGGFGGSGIGLLDIIIIGLLIYFGWKLLKRRRPESAPAGYYSEMGPARIDGFKGAPSVPIEGGAPREQYASTLDLEKGLDQIMLSDRAFTPEAFKETVQDLFFRIQAGWMNRSLDGLRDFLTSEMADFFKKEFALLKQKRRINRLENIAVRRVDLAEAWQEMGKDYITVLFTANLLDYTVDDQTGEVVEGDKLNPVKFEEFWTFSRDIGSVRWQLSAINQVDQPLVRH